MMRLLHKGESLCCIRDSASVTYGDCCIKANRGVAFGLRLRSHTEVCSLQTSPSAPCASSFLQSLDNLASKIVRLLTFTTVSFLSYISPVWCNPSREHRSSSLQKRGNHSKRAAPYHSSPSFWHPACQGISLEPKPQSPQEGENANHRHSEVEVITAIEGSKVDRN